MTATQSTMQSAMLIAIAVACSVMAPTSDAHAATTGHDASAVLSREVANTPELLGAS